MLLGAVRCGAINNQQNRRPQRDPLSTMEITVTCIDGIIICGGDRRFGRRVNRRQTQQPSYHFGRYRKCLYTVLLILVSLPIRGLSPNTPPQAVETPKPKPVTCRLCFSGVNALVRMSAVCCGSRHDCICNTFCCICCLIQ
jgi:hypothetical protein